MRDRLVSFRVPVVVQDALLAMFVILMQVQGTIGRDPAETASRPLSELGYVGIVLLVASGAVVALRRRWPVLVFLCAALSSLLYYSLDFPDGPTWLGLFVAVYTLTAYGDGRRSLITAGTGICVLTVGWLVTAVDVEPRAAIGWVFFRIGTSVMSAALGESVRTRRVIAAEALARAERAERTREEEARARVDAERIRIAREVHDTVAHAIAIINVQAGVTAHVLGKRPERVRETLVAIEQTSSQALGEMRAILGVLRASSEERVPYPGLAQIGDLVSKARAAGLEIALETAPPPAPLPSAVGSAVYRILQEAITNVIRHVGPTRVTVALDYGPDAVEVRVIDEGRRPSGGDDSERDTPNRRHPTHDAAAGSAEEGRGIVGMRERCHLLGGELDAGPLPVGGFEVRARLPVAPMGTVRL